MPNPTGIPLPSPHSRWGDAISLLCRHLGALLGQLSPWFLWPFLLPCPGQRALKCDPHFCFLEAPPRAWPGASLATGAPACPALTSAAISINQCPCHSQL